ncbi:MAG: hypothetical protein WA441_13085 [Methyloceanibacter sp.]|jgi:hypothetical protein
MTDQEKLLRDMKTLMESIKLDWSDVGTKALTGEERTQIRTHIEWCIKELKSLHELLDSLK